MSPIVSASALVSRANDARLVLLDARSGPDRRARFERAHLAGARFVDLDLDLAELGDPARGGRHPLPAPADLARKLGALGVTPTSAVVVYDDRDGANAAARAWWLLRAIGHADVTLLDGGLGAAEAAGFPIETGPGPRVDAAPPYPTDGYRLPTCSIEEVDRARTDPSSRILDARDGARFRAETEPFDPVAGHVPGATSAPYASGLDAAGLLRSPAELRTIYDGLLGGVPPERTIVHCGSGVTACHTLLQLELAGLPGASLWVGSWSEWCRQPERPVARGPA